MLAEPEIAIKTEIPKINELIKAKEPRKLQNSSKGFDPQTPRPVFTWF